MAYTSKNPKFDSTILKDEGTSSVDNPAFGSHKIVDRSGQLFVRNSSGSESAQKPRSLANIAGIKALSSFLQTGDIAIDTFNNATYIYNGASLATADDDLVLLPDSVGGRWLRVSPNNAGVDINLSTNVTGTTAIGNGGTGQTTQTAAFDALSPTTTKGDIIAYNGTDNVRVAVGADGLILKADSAAAAGVSWGSASSGSGEINYIDNPDAEANTTGWATYADAAGSTPVDGTGGSPTVTWTRQSSVILRGNQSFQLTKDAANRQGQGVSYDFTIKAQDVSKKLKIQFDFKTNEDAAYASGDLTVYIYDVTNSTLITPVDTDIIDGQNIFQTSFNSTTSTSYRLIFHIATTNASAWDAYIDNVIVGPGMTSQGAAIGPVESYTLTNSNVTNDAGLTITGQMSTQRVGDNLLVFGQLAFTGTGTDVDPLTVDLDTILPTPVTIITGRYGNATQDIFNSTATSRYAVSGHILTDGTDSIQFTRTPGSGTGLRGNQFGNTGVLRDNLIFSGSLPVTEWAGKGIVPMLAENNLSEWQSYTPSGLTGGEWGTSTNIRVEYRRVGDSMEIRGEFTTGTPTASEAQIDLPSGYTIGGTATGTVPVGEYFRDAAPGAFGTPMVILATAGDTFLNIGRQIIDASGNSTQNVLAPMNADRVGSSERQAFSASIPIVEFAGSQNSLVGYSEASENNLGLVVKPKTVYAKLSATTSAFADNTYQTIVLDSVVYNTFDSEYNSGTGVFTVSETGLYLLTAGATISAVTSGQLRQAIGTLYINGNEESDNIFNFATTTDQDLTVFMGSGAKTKYLTAGTTVALRTYAATISSTTWNVVGSASDEPTYMAITKLA